MHLIIFIIYLVKLDSSSFILLHLLLEISSVSSTYCENNHPLNLGKTHVLTHWKAER